MATSLIGPFLTESASPAAPVPRPPQPTSATWMVLFSAAWTWGMATPARADTAAILPVFLMNSRREVRESWVSFIGDIFLTLPERCQFKKNRVHTALCGARHGPRGRAPSSLRPSERRAAARRGHDAHEL